MGLYIFILNEWLANTKHLIIMYEQMDYIFNREVIINDLKKLQKSIEEELEIEIKILTKNNG